MLLVQITQLIVAFLHIALGFLVLRARHPSAVNRAFAAQSFVFAGWVLGIAGLQSGKNLDWWAGLSFAFAALIPTAFLVFSHCYPATSTWSAPPHARLAGGLSAIFVALSLGTNLLSYDATVTVAGFERKSGPLYPFFAVFFLGTWCAGLCVFARKWFRSRGLARAQFHYLGAGLICGFLGGISTNLILPLTGQSNYSWIGPYFSLVYVGFVAHAIIRLRLMDLRLFIHRGLTIGFAIVLSAVPAGLVLTLFWPRLLVTFDTSELAFLLAAVGIVTLLTPVTRDVASRLLDRYVYRTQANYQRTVREASQMLTRVLNLKALLRFISSTVVRSTGAESVALYLREGSPGKEFCCAFTESGPGITVLRSVPQAPIDVVTALEMAQEPILADEVARERDAPFAALHQSLTRTNWALVLPVLSEDALIALIAVGPKLSGDAFYQHDLDLLMTLANQAGVAIKNAQLYAAVVVANEYIENIAATIESGVIAIDAAGRVAMFNRAAEQLTGLAAEATKGAAAAVLPLCLAEPLLATAADGQPRTQPEVELATVAAAPDGPASRPVICTISPVRDPAGAVLGAVAVVSDLTPLKELEVERRRAEQLAYFQALASGIAHEIKNPLVAIKTFSQLLPRRRGDERFLEEFGRIATREIDRIQRLVDRLRTLSRPAGGPRQPIDIRVPLADVLALVRPTLEEKSLVLVASLGADPAIVLGNHPELEALFLNLVLNAHDMTPSGGTVTLDVSRTETHVTVTVSDSGPGIPPELTERVFEPFFTTKARGSGLGLAISAGIAQAHGARLRADNRPAGGAIFTVEFPVASVVSAMVV
jgi:PAS domain S-box-containing protein